MRDRGASVGRCVRVVCVAAALLLAAGVVHAQPSDGAKPVPTALIERRPLVPTKPATRASSTSDSTPREPASPGSITRTLIATASVVAIIVIAGFGVKKLMKRSGGLMAALGAGGKAPSGVLQVLGRYPVASGMQLVILKFDRRVLLVAQSGGKALRGAATMQTLCELTDPSDVASVLVKCGGEEQAKLAAQFQSILRGEDASMDQALVVRTPTTIVQDAAPRLAPRTHRPQPAPARAETRPEGRDSREAATAIRARLAAMRSVDRVSISGGAA